MPHNRRREQVGLNLHAAAGDGRGKRSRWNRQHLYLVVDDWNNGFSLHKIDADSFFNSSSSTGSGSGDDLHHGDIDEGALDARRLPEPPALRVQSPDGRDVSSTGMTFSALGTKIFVSMNHRCGLVYDTDTAVLVVGAHTPANMVCGFGISVAVGEVLYLLTYRYLDTHGHHSFEAMSRAPNAGGSWSWNTLQAPPPTFTTRQRVVAHAVHPDGCTIFMTTANKDTPGDPLGTYSFDTEAAAWRWHGECALPFVGQGHFDAELGVWVGVHRDGYVCCCQPVSTDFVSTRRPVRKSFVYTVDPDVYLDCKITTEKLFRKDTERSSIGATLTYMGSSRYCLVECMQSKRVGDSDGSVLHLTIFGLKYNDKGELQTTDHRSTRSILVSRHRGHFRPFAFWM